MSGLRRLERLAAEIAIDAPERRSRYSSEAKVAWRLIEAIRAELDAKGIDWRPMARRVAEVKQENAERWHRERAEAFRHAHSTGKASA